MSRNPVMVVGAGIGGSAARTPRPQQRGIDVEVYEQAPELRRSGPGMISAGTRVLPPGGSSRRSMPGPAARQEIRHWKAGQHLKLLTSAPSRSSATALLHHPPCRLTAFSRCASGTIPDGIRLARVSVEQDADAVSCASKTEKHADGCDGATGAFRRARQRVRRQPSKGLPAAWPGAGSCRDVAAGHTEAAQ